MTGPIRDLSALDLRDRTNAADRSSADALSTDVMSTDVMSTDVMPTDVSLLHPRPDEADEFDRPVARSIDLREARVARRDPRLAIDAVEQTVRDVDVDVRVTLCRSDAVGDVRYVGESANTATTTGIDRAVAEATTAALELACAHQVRIGVEQVRVIDLAARPTVVVLTSISGTRGWEHLTGSALVREDRTGAIVRATLSALHRHVGWYLPPV